MIEICQQQEEKRRSDGDVFVGCGSQERTVDARFMRKLEQNEPFRSHHIDKPSF